MHSDLISQTRSYEADYRRDYRPYPLNEQQILDYITFLCIVIDTYVVSTLVSFIYFPEHISKFQNISLILLFTLYAGRQFGEFLWQLGQHREFVNSRKQFTMRAWESPNIEYICQLVWNNPDSVLDFRTHPVRVGQRFIREPVIISQPQLQPQQQPQEQQIAPVPAVVYHPIHNYNTRSQARARQAAPVE